VGTSRAEWGKVKKFGERLGKVCTSEESGGGWGTRGKVLKGGERWGRWGKVGQVRERMGKGRKR
jgi:hypothetical protein